MAEFHWIPALGGGLLIGISATLLLTFNGRIAGISGIVSGSVICPGRCRSRNRDRHSVCAASRSSPFRQPFLLAQPPRHDGPLLAGAALFGIGWGLSGYCPGSGIVALVLVSWQPLVFLAALIAGMAAYQGYQSVTQSANRATQSNS